jgi:phosphomannomutase
LKTQVLVLADAKRTEYCFYLFARYSIKLVQILYRKGYSQVHIVEEQRVPNGSTVKSPNPEEPEALTMALALADKTNADIVVGTDPDCDRLGLLLE